MKNQNKIYNFYFARQRFNPHNNNRLADVPMKAEYSFGKKFGPEETQRESPFFDADYILDMMNDGLVSALKKEFTIQRISRVNHSEFFNNWDNGVLALLETKASEHPLCEVIVYGSSGTKYEIRLAPGFNPTMREYRYNVSFPPEMFENVLHIQEYLQGKESCLVFDYRHW